MKYLFRKIESGYSEDCQIAAANFNPKNGLYGKHIIFWGKNSREVKAFCDKLPEIINFYLEMKEGKD